MLQLQRTVFTIDETKKYVIRNVYESGSESILDFYKSPLTQQCFLSMIPNTLTGEMLMELWPHEVLRAV
jgi:hypothetical protein